ncbi:uncharacterized protein MONOS_3725 [Monocercomonoides exilis]|uniref:uncharacterized protein n=1 Tax=Monocercomonoides exilis TaxID=2049356 RepID=UPI003559411F|nr:hypothetical protein MONOS_3725 [Monocercomonoides exilis]|eukprot:MONOS_3725.1-p1 / transcript=MONOS_3725.1 / gene=MONOS_3725 / organism=Monocercomonoides_exilis_PA203 / gene_product=unspecified product / transcript_product=unspecified product / location=Mono_scaffold00090:110389-117707(-) / protein_length=2418 / sequence_SO=supercontig / SO=protein_coding / is_pseudo=false
MNVNIAPSLVEVPSKSMDRIDEVDAEVHNSEFSSFVQGSSPFLQISPLTSITISECCFFNVSQRKVNAKSCPSSSYLNPDKRCELNCMNCIAVQNPYLGCIVDGATSAFICCNSSFLSCEAVTTRTNFSTGSKEFNDTTFMVKSAEELDGGAIYLIGDATLTTKRCSFESCSLAHSNARAGAVGTDGEGSWLCENTSFQNCTVTYAAAAFDLMGKESFEISLSNLSHCSSGDGLGGGEIRRCLTCLITNCIFQCNEAKRRYAGALNCYIMEHNFSVVSCLFKSNRACTNGGAIRFDHSQVYSITATLSDCIFINNSAGEGNDIYANISWNGKLNLVASRLFSTSNQPRTTFAWATAEETSHYVLDPPIIQDKIIIAPNGEDWDNCGRSDFDEFNCLTMKKGIERAKIESMSFEIKEGLFPSGQIDIGSSNVIGSGSGMLLTSIKSDIKNEEEALFRISTGKMEASEMKFIHDGSNEYCRSSSLFLMSESSGILVLSSCKITCETPSAEQFFSKPLISSEKGEVTLDLCNIEGSQSLNTFIAKQSGDLVVNDTCITTINRQTGNGGAMEVELADEVGFIVKNVSLKQCKVGTTNEKGGGIYLVLCENSTRNYQLDSVNVSGNDAKWGKDVFVQCVDLNQSVTTSRIANIKNDDGDKLDFFGIDSSMFLEAPVNLSYFFLQRQSLQIEISQSGKDISGCGDEVFPCNSFWKGFKNLAIDVTNEKKELRIYGSTLVQDQFIFSCLMISSKQDEKNAKLTFNSVVVNGSSEVMLLNENNLEFDRICFNIPSSFSVSISSLISSADKENSNLVLKNCSFENKTKDNITFSLLLVLGGTLRVEQCTVSQMAFGSSPAIISDKAHADLGMFSFSSVKLTSCTLISIVSEESSNNHAKGNEEAQSLTLSSCTFEGITSSGSNMACILSSTINSPILINQCSFLTISSKGSNEGGALGISLQEKGALTVNKTETSRCECESDASGRGGFLFLNCIDYANMIKFEDLHFINNMAAIGKDMFIVCSDLTELVNSTSFSFAMDIEQSERVNSLIGFDRTHFANAEDLFIFITGYFNETIHVDGKRGINNIACGKLNFPCNSLNFGLNRAQGKGTKNLLISGGSSLLEEVSMDNVAVKSEQENSSSRLEVNETLANSVGVAISAYLASFSSIIFSLPPIFTNLQKAFMETLDSESCLSISECSFNLQSEGILSFILLSVKNGDLNLYSCSIEILQISKPFIEFHQSSDSKGGSLTMEHCLFGSVTQSSNSACILITTMVNDANAMLSNSSFASCAADASDCGGALHVKMEEGGRFEIYNTKISSCSAIAGKGGGVFLNCLSKKNKTIPFHFKNITFSNNKARVGRDVFVKCFSISKQISEEQFDLDFREPPYDRFNAIWGVDETLPIEDVDLIPLIVVYRSELIFVCGVNDEGNDAKPCGNSTTPCKSLSYGLSHIISSAYSQLLIDRECDISQTCTANSVTVKSLNPATHAVVHLRTEISESQRSECILESVETVKFECVSFLFQHGFVSTLKSIFTQTNGSFVVASCLFSCADNSICLSQSLFTIESGSFDLSRTSVKHINASQELFELRSSCFAQLQSVEFGELTLGSSLIDACEGSNLIIKEINTSDITIENSSLISVEERSISKMNEENLESSIMIIHSNVSGIKRRTQGACSLSFPSSFPTLCQISNCSFSNHTSSSANAQILELSNSIYIESSILEGYQKDIASIGNSAIEDVCHWNGSLIYLASCTSYMKDTKVANSSKGGISVSKGRLTIEMGMFEGNNPSVERYPSARRNIICDEGGVVDVMSLKGGDGLLPNSSMWILNEGCEMEGVALERTSVLFIPHLERVEQEEAGAEIKLKFIGHSLMPCHLQFRVTTILNEEKSLHTNKFKDSEYVNESEIVTSIQPSLVKDAPSEAEVSVCILFGDKARPSSTRSFVLKNKSDPQSDANGKLAKEGSGAVSSWALIIIVIFVILFLIVLIASIILAVRWRSAKEEAKKYKEIVDDNIRKDPKAFEMVTMEMSPEEQWRRAEREAEKKNEDNIKKRVNEKSLGHSESEEYLLSECGSTEYILGRDSDKIPQWMLEKVEEEEIRKRSPSPSISSTSTTSTTDSDSTFVRGEDLCPTTSSMSNLVDAMACSSPHEKLIVDLRDSLFLLLHGRNEKKEMAIGTLTEREHTAAQVLFWVANGALHSFDEMENPLQSLDNLSPHIVLFSEHMVICIVMHSDCSSSSDDSDTSSISHSTVVTSSSDNSLMSERFTKSPPPSSAFEDEDYNLKESLRWKAPELMFNKTMTATNSSVAFSIGMMLWECLSLEIPFGEYEAEIAGKKITNGERPSICIIVKSRFYKLIKQCFAQLPNDRPSLARIKREFFNSFPADAVILTISDAIDLENESCNGKDSKGESEAALSNEIVNVELINGKCSIQK